MNPLHRFTAIALIALFIGALPGAGAGATRERVVGRFHNYDGAQPKAPLLVDANGAFYGTTSVGGVRGIARFGRSGKACESGCGTVFKLERGGSGFKKTVIYEFQGGTDGAIPLAGLVADASGVLFGTTSSGGGPGCNRDGCGTVFKLIPTGSAYRERVVHAFSDRPNDGAFPIGGLTFGADGALYGSTSSGGFLGGGTIYKITQTPSGYAERVVHVFGSLGDGAGPASTLIVDRTGALYGTTQTGRGPIYGTVFKLTPSQGLYTEHILHAFGLREGDGWEPGTNLAMDGAGNLYGTTPYGGYHCNCGTVYKLTRNASTYFYRVIYSFLPYRDGYQPLAPVTIGSGGVLYGTTYSGGSDRYQSYGTVFKLTPTSAGYTRTVLHRFGKHDAVWPAASLMAYNGRLYGTAVAGYGLAPFGAVFSILP